MCTGPWHIEYLGYCVSRNCQSAIDACAHMVLSTNTVQNHI